MKIDNIQIQNILQSQSNTQPTPKKADNNNDVDASLQADFAALIDQAAKASDTDANAVKQAEQLLASGQLDSPENITQAAKNIIDFGI